MITFADIGRFQLAYPRVFSEVHTIPGAVVYRQENNLLSWDGNHACILRNDDLTPVLIDAVTWMHEDWGVTARVFSAGPTEDQEDIKSLLAGAGYTISGPEQGTLFFVRAEAKVLAGNGSALPRLEVREIKAMVPGLEDLYRDTPWDLGCILNSFAKKKLRVFGGFVGGRLVCGASCTTLEGLSFLDHVKTLGTEQAKGYCQALLDNLVNNPAYGKPEQQFLHSSNPAAIHIYKKLGYGVLEGKNRFWMATRDGSAPTKGRSGSRKPRR